MWFWILKWVVLGPVVRWFTRPEVIGMENVPKSGPVVICPNHQSEVESLVLCLVLRRQPRFIAKVEYFSGGGLRGIFERLLVKATGQIPVDRAGGSASSGALLAAEELLSGGGVWAVYPEGTRSPDGRLYRGKTGAVRVALACPQAVVVPVSITGALEIEAHGKRGWRRGRVRVEFGSPLSLAGYAADNPEDWRRATDALMARIQEMSGQEYVDRYAERPKRAA